MKSILRLLPLVAAATLAACAVRSSPFRRTHRHQGAFHRAVDAGERILAHGPVARGGGVLTSGARLGLLGLLALGGCEAGQPARSGPPAPVAPAAAPPSTIPEETRMWMTVGERRFAITLTDDAAARAFAAQLPLTLDMSELNGNEKHADLQEALPTNAIRPGTIRTGDLMLYGTNTLVVFYATFTSPYSYTRLGRVDDPADLPKALGRRGVRVEFSKD